MNDPLILVRPERETVMMYNTHARLVKTVRFRMLQEKQANGEAVHRMIREQKEIQRLTRSLQKAEEKKPGILENIVFEDNCSETAAKFGLTRQRVHQIKTNLERFAEIKRVKYQTVWREFA